MKVHELIKLLGDHDMEATVQVMHLESCQGGFATTGDYSPVEEAFDFEREGKKFITLVSYE